jgi:HEAT repeat protein
MSYQYGFLEDDEEMQPIEDFPDDYKNESQSIHVSAIRPTFNPPSARIPGGSFGTLPSSSSDHILHKVLDQDLSINSPSRRKRLKMLQVPKSREESPYNTKGSTDRLTAKKFRNYHEESIPFTEKASKLRQSFENCSDFQELEDLPSDEKVLKFITVLSSPNSQKKLAGLQGIHESVERQEISLSVKEKVLSEVFSLLEKWDEYDIDVIECCLDVIGSIGPHRISINNIPLLASILIHDETTDTPSIHQAAFACLSRLGPSGIESLVKIASKDYAYLQIWVLERLVLTNTIQRNIIVPALVQDALSPNSNLRLQAVAAINRMYSVAWEGGALPVLLNLMEEGSVDRQLLACTIRACGTPGEQALIRILKNNPVAKIRMAASGALCWRVPSRPKQLEIRLVNENIRYQLMAGSMCKYIGPCTPVVLKEDQEALLEINVQDFLSSLQRWIRSENTQDVFPNLLQFKVNLENTIDDKSEISIPVVRALSSALRDEFEGVRETSAYALGFIGIPEAADSIESLTKLLKDPSAQVRTMAAWAIGRLGSVAYKAGPALISLLKDSYWKVRTAACISLASAGHHIANSAIPILYRILKDGSINRNTVAETIVRLGPTGEKLLIDMLNKEPNGNSTLRCGAIKALAHANVYNNNIDFVVEALFQLSNDNIPTVRREVLLTLKALAEKAKLQVTYLKPRMLLPLYFNFMKDPAKEVRDASTLGIVSAGPQGQLMLIEAMTKDDNYVVRAQAIKGLGVIGSSTFRSLLLGLHDPHPGVRKASADTISLFSPESINEEFWEKASQRQSMKCAIREILKLPYPIQQNTSNLLKELLEILESETKLEDPQNNTSN